MTKKWRWPAEGSIYFMSFSPRAVRGGVKIGISRDPQERLRGLIRELYRGTRALGRYDQGLLLQQWANRTFQDEFFLHRCLWRRGFGYPYCCEWYEDSAELRAALNDLGYSIDPQPYTWAATTPPTSR